MAQSPARRESRSVRRAARREYRNQVRAEQFGVQPSF